MNLRMTLVYWPAYGTGGRVLPALAIHQRPNPKCPACDGCGYTAYEIDCADEAPCACTREKPLALLPLPRIVNRNYREFKRRRRAQKGWTCWFCSAENGDAYRRCLSCGHSKEE
ncbi:hypothetical protein [Streptomyces vietnamensis]|uniref:hypothetical protein n=1 Tax=Streptomyces vietnamensis TaxID=362257 RepID=UPI00342852D0